MLVRLFIVAVLVLIVSPSYAQKRIALLIGNQGYTDAIGPLKNPHNDVVLIGASLKQIGFKVRVLKDASYRQMDIAIKRHAAEVRRAGAGAISFFYFSGHGIANPDTRRNFLVPIDVENAKDENFWFAAFEQNLVIARLREAAPQATHYVVFDACRNELNIKASVAKGVGDQKGFVPVTDTAGILIAYATAPRQTASDAGEGGGAYAKALAAELVRPGVEAVTMFRRVQLRVKQAIGQDPWLSIPTLPEVYLAGKKLVAATTPQVSATSIAPTVGDPAYLPLFKACVRAREHIRKKRLIQRLQERMSRKPHHFGWLPEGRERAKVRIRDRDLAWKSITSAKIIDGILELDFNYRNGKLRLVPVLSRAWGTRTAKKTAFGLQGLWVTDNSYGCIELRIDDFGDGRGMWGVHESKSLDSPVFLRAIPSGWVQKKN